MNGKIYIEGGGGDSKEMHTRCREGFRRLLEKCGFQKRMPRLVACGGRDETYKNFDIAHRSNKTTNYVGMLVDSEDPVVDHDQTWAHLKARDNWDKPTGADDEQVLLMATCMETWIAADRPSLKKYHGTKLRENDLPPLVNLETRHRHDVQEGLSKATRDCKNKYQKGKRSFELLAALEPAELRKQLEAFRRFERVLKKRL